MEWNRCLAVLSSRASLLGLLVLLAQMSVAGLLARLWWPLELTTHFPLQYALVLGAGALALLLLRRVSAALVAGVLAAANLGLVLSASTWTAPPQPAGHTYRLLFANVCFDNPDHDRILSLVDSARPDLVVLTEMESDWFAALEPLGRSYPYCTCKEPEDVPESILWSRLPVDDYQVLPFSRDDLTSFRARIGLEGRSLTLVGVHTMSPRGGVNARHRNEELDELGRYAAGRTGPLIVVGDLNCTPWSPYFRDLLRQSGLADSRRGFGVQPSWPAWLPLPGIPIDHCLVSSEVEVIDRRVGPDIGSDHYPIVIDFTLK
jgi:endonuclease/exonuclease/phosphatase (EEP) superfamily protein YafD